MENNSYCDIDFHDESARVSQDKQEIENDNSVNNLDDNAASSSHILVEVPEKLLGDFREQEERNQIEESDNPTSDTAQETQSVLSAGNDPLVRSRDFAPVNLNTLYSQRHDALLSELRQLQIGERPVTGRNTRENLNNFFQNGATPLDRDNISTQIQNDVQNLRQQSLVRSALQTDSFRARLERILGGMGPNPRVAVPNIRATQPLTHRTTQRTPTESDWIDLLTSVVHQQVDSGAAGNLIQSHDVAFDSPGPSSTTTTGPSTTTTVTNSERGPIEVEDVYESRSTPESEFVEREIELLALTIAEDIRTLKNLQIVNNILRTDFRGQLEGLIQEQAQRAGIRNTVQQPAQRLHREHNVSSGAPLQPSSDNEMQNLRQELAEMKQLLAASFELQKNTQRLIRQEVSAVFNVFMQDYLLPRHQEVQSGTTLIDLPTTSQPAERPQVTPVATDYPRHVAASSGQCVVCSDRTIDTVLYHCGHMCVCLQCGIHLNSEGHKCPMCRAPIRDVIRVYQCQDEPDSKGLDN